MKKILPLFLFLFSVYANAGMINAIALIVNDEPISLYDIDEKMLKERLSKQDAVGKIIDEILYNQELKKNGISVDFLDISNYIDKLAASNGLDTLEFKSVVRQKYKDYSIFEEEIKARLKKDKLVAKIVRGNIKLANEEDLKLYYDNNYNQFNSASKFDVKQYVSKNKQSLIDISKNPMLLKNDVIIQPTVLTQIGLSPQIKYMLNNTDEKNFTPIFSANGQFIMLFINSKSDFLTQSFDEVKEKIFNIVMGEREQQFLKEYFEKLKLKAQIKVVR